MSALHETIHARRLRSGMTREQLSARSGVPLATIVAAEGGVAEAAAASSPVAQTPQVTSQRRASGSVIAAVCLVGVAGVFSLVGALCEESFIRTPAAAGRSVAFARPAPSVPVPAAPDTGVASVVGFVPSDASSSLRLQEHGLLVDADMRRLSAQAAMTNALLDQQAAQNREVLDRIGRQSAAVESMTGQIRLVAAIQASRSGGEGSTSQDAGDFAMRVLDARLNLDPDSARAQTASDSMLFDRAGMEGYMATMAESLGVIVQSGKRTRPVGMHVASVVPTAWDEARKAPVSWRVVCDFGMEMSTPALTQTVPSTATLGVVRAPTDGRMLVSSFAMSAATEEVAQ